MSDASADPELVCRDVMQRRRSSLAYADAIKAARVLGLVDAIRAKLEVRADRGDDARILDLTADPAAQRMDWIERRRVLITASDCAAILGADKRRGPFAVWAAKVHGIQGEQTPEMRMGHRMEPVIADLYEEETGRRVEDLGASTLTVHPTIPWLAATLDRVTWASEKRPAPRPGRGVLEIKNVGGYNAREWEGDPPLGYLIQTYFEMACAGCEWGSLVALIGGNQLVIRDLVRDDEFLAAAIPVLDKFRGMVERREAPDADGADGTVEAVRKMWPSSNGKTIGLDGAAQDLADELDRIKGEARDLERQAKAIENKLRAKMGENEIGVLGDGSSITLTTVYRSAYTAEATSYRKLARVWPKTK